VPGETQGAQDLWAAAQREAMILSLPDHNWQTWDMQ
jgi:hypothetical protein